MTSDCMRWITLLFMHFSAVYMEFAQNLLIRWTGACLHISKFKLYTLKPLRLYSIRLDCTTGARSGGRAFGGGGVSRLEEGAARCCRVSPDDSWGTEAFSGPLLWRWGQWKQGGGRNCRVEEFMLFLRHQALSWWWGEGCAAGTGRQI